MNATKYLYVYNRFYGRGFLEPYESLNYLDLHFLRRT